MMFPMVYIRHVLEARGGSAFVRSSARTLALAALFVLTSGCWVLSPRLDPHDPQVNGAATWLLADVPEDHVQDQLDPVLLGLRGEFLASAGAPPAWRARAIEEHQIAWGQASQEVVLAMLSHPTSIERQGPPGGCTYLWEAHRWWVRFDEMGRAVAVGRY